MKCQVCSSPDLSLILSLGDIPSANVMTCDAPKYPADVWKCGKCSLVQLGLILDPSLVFPMDYPYRSGTTKSLRANFEDLAMKLTQKQVGSVLDIGSNDGTLLTEFKLRGWKTHGVEPTDQALKARLAGHRVTQEFFSEDVAREIGTFDVITATNVFAHVEDVHDFMRGVLAALKPDGIFVTESTYWCDTLKFTAYDTIYHEHLRYYTLRSLTYLLGMYGMVPYLGQHIETMGGSIRIYARRGSESHSQVEEIVIREDARSIWEDGFAKQVSDSRDALRAIVPPSAWGIGAPSRATTLINYTGIDLEAVCEITGSDKIGKVIPGTTIPVVDECELVAVQPDFALILSWHIAVEVAGNLRRRGYKGKFIVPLPTPCIFS